MKREITLKINGREETITVEDADTLLERPTGSIQTLERAGKLRCWSVRDLHRITRWSSRQFLFPACGSSRRPSYHNP